MFNLKVSDTCKPHFRLHGLLTLPCLYILEIAIFVKVKKYLFPALAELFNRSRRITLRLNVQIYYVWATIKQDQQKRAYYTWPHVSTTIYLKF